MKSFLLALAVASIAVVVFFAMRLGDRDEVARPEVNQLDVEPAFAGGFKPPDERDANAGSPVHVAPQPSKTPAQDAPLGSVWLTGRFRTADGALPSRIDSFKVRAFGAGRWSVFERPLELDRNSHFELELTEAFDAWPNVTAIELVASKGKREADSARLDVRDVPRRRCFEARVTLELSLQDDEQGRLVVRGRVNCGVDAHVTISSIDPRSENALNPGHVREFGCWEPLTDDGVFSVFECNGWYPNGPPETLWIAVYCNGWLPYRREIQTYGQMFIDVGTLELERGESIRGRIPLTATALDRVTVCATELEQKPIDAFSSQARWIDPSGYTVCAETNAAGEFELTGLKPGWYRLKLVNVPGLGDTYTKQVDVLAPATDVVIQPELCRVDILVQREGVPVKQARLEVRRRDEGSGFHLRRSLISDANGRASAWVLADLITEIAIGERIFPVTAGAPGGVIPLVIEL